jgi:predicted MFS family arabinose efflux permease
MLILRTGAAKAPATNRPERQSPWRDLKEGALYVWSTPDLLGTLFLALLLNMTAFPLAITLLPYVVKDIYGGNQTLLGYVVTCAAIGAVCGSLAMTRFTSLFGPSRLMIHGSIGWFVLLLVFSQIRTPWFGMITLFFSGIAQAIALVSMATVLLRNSDEKYRGRIMGVRMLAIYSNMPGIMLAGFLIPRVGYPAVAAAYCVFGILMTIAIVYCWRASLWSDRAAANALQGG